MLRAELVDLVVDFVEDPQLVVVGTVLLDRLHHVVLLQDVHHLDFVEADHHSTPRAARDRCDFICLRSRTLDQ
eukprot:2452520-Rhodomonas_salina.2